MKSPLILASQSPRRAELLRQAGIAFLVLPSRVREGRPRGEPAAWVRKLALRKAEEVAARLRRRGERSGLVLGADTVVALGRRIFGKPRSRAEAARMLARLSGRAHQVLTGLALIPLEGGRPWTAVERTRVWFRKLSEAEIAAYVRTGEPMDKAGAYGIQGRAGAFVRKISGDYFNVVGLPIGCLAERLENPCFRRKAQPLGRYPGRGATHKGKRGTARNPGLGRS